MVGFQAPAAFSAHGVSWLNPHPLSGEVHDSCPYSPPLWPGGLHYPPASRWSGPILQRPGKISRTETACQYL